MQRKKKIKIISSILLLSTLIYVNRPVASIQLDVKTSGAVTNLIADKTIATALQPDGFTRIVIFGLNTTMFNGLFLEIDDKVEALKNVHASDADANPVNVAISYLDSPENLQTGE